MEGTGDIENLNYSRGGSRQHFLSNALHAVNVAFTGFLTVLIGLKRPESPTAFDTHSVSMTSCLISVCFYFIMIMVRIILETVLKTVRFTRFLNHALVSAGVLTPASLISVFLPYKPLLFIGFVCLFLCSVLAHYAYESIYGCDDNSG